MGQRFSADGLPHRSVRVVDSDVGDFRSPGSLFRTGFPDVRACLAYTRPCQRVAITIQLHSQHERDQQHSAQGHSRRRGTAADFSSVQSERRFSSSAQAPSLVSLSCEELIELTICSRSGPTTATSSQGVTQVVLVLSHIIRWRSRGVMSPGFPSKLHSRWVRSSGSRVRSSRSPLILVGFFSIHFSSLDPGPFLPFQLSINTDGLGGRDRGRAQSRRRVRERSRRLNHQVLHFVIFWSLFQLDHVKEMTPNTHSA